MPAELSLSVVIAWLWPSAYSRRRPGGPEWLPQEIGNLEWVEFSMRLIYTYRNFLQGDDAWRIAIHESGHAIAAVKFYKLFDRVEIGDREQGAVHFTFEPPEEVKQNRSLQNVRDWQTVYGAGAGAEHLFFGQIRRHAFKCDFHWHERMDKISKQRVRDTFENAIKRSARSMTKAELNAVARELVARRQLNFDEVAGLIGVRLPWSS